MAPAAVLPTEEYRRRLLEEYERIDDESTEVSELGLQRAREDDYSEIGAKHVSTTNWKSQHSHGAHDFWAHGDRLDVGMTEEEKFTFDLAGFFVRPSILSAEEVATLREQVYLMKHAPEQLPPHERACPGGASSLLIDHPKVIEVLHEIIGHKQVRLEAAGAQWRVRGEREGAGPDGLSQGEHDPL